MIHAELVSLQEHDNTKYPLKVSQVAGRCLAAVLSLRFGEQHNNLQGMLSGMFWLCGGAGSCSVALVHPVKLPRQHRACAGKQKEQQQWSGAPAVQF